MPEDCRVPQAAGRARFGAGSLPMARILLLRAHGDRGKRAKGRVFLCPGKRNRLQVPDGALAVDPESISTRMAGPRSDPYVGGAGAGVWRAVKTRCFAPEEGWTRR